MEAHAAVPKFQPRLQRREGRAVTKISHHRGPISSEAKASLTQVLAALVIAVIPVGPLVQAPIGGKTFSISASQTLILLLCAHLMMSSLARRTQRVPGVPWPLGVMALAAGLMLPPVFFGPDLGAAAQAYMNFLLGTAGGILIGYIWRMAVPDRIGIIDCAIAVFLLWASAQLLLAFVGSAELGLTLHQAAVVPWGGSNYVAGVMSVAAFALIGRLRQLAKVKLVFFIPVVAGLATAAATLSRGAILASAVGLAVYLWRAGRTPARTLLFRLGALSVPLLAWAALVAVTNSRLAVNSQAAKNIDIRFDQYALAWTDLASSPLIGNGWLSFRETAYAALGNQTSFVHNFVMSFLQMGGLLFGLPFLIVLIVCAYRASRREGTLISAIVAAFTIALSDPFFESTVAAIVVWAVLGRSISRASKPPPIHRGRAGHPSGRK